MPRTTLDIDAPVLREIRALQRKERRSMGKIVSTLLTEALAARETSQPNPPFEWHSQPMGVGIDLTDKEALYAILDEDGQ